MIRSNKNLTDADTPTKEQLLANLVKLQKQMSSLIDNYMDRDRADTAKFMTKRTALDNQIQETKDAIAAHSG